MTEDIRALCIELVDALEKADWPRRHVAAFGALLGRAHAVLAKPEDKQAPSEGREPAAVHGVTAQAFYEDYLEREFGYMRH